MKFQEAEVIEIGKVEVVWLWFNAENLPNFQTSKPVEVVYISAAE